MEENKRPTNKKEIAKMLGINVKTMNSATEYSDNLQKIESNIGEERYNAFEQTVTSLEKNKKKKISNEQIRQLSRLSQDKQIQIVDRIIENPKNAKDIINIRIPNCKTKITVTLPVWVNDHYDYLAESYGMSKGKYLEFILTGLCKADMEEEIKKNQDG